MVTTIVLAALVVAGLWLRMYFKFRHQRDMSELYQALYENERDGRIDYELELARVQTLLADSQATVSRLIGRNARIWAEAEATRVH